MTYNTNSNSENPTRITVQPYQPIHNDTNRNSQINSINHLPSTHSHPPTIQTSSSSSIFSFRNFIKTTAALSLYMFCGIGLTMLNKYLLSPQYYGFQFPIFLITIHMLTNSICSFLWLHLFLKKSWKYHPLWPSNLSLHKFMKKFLLIGALFGGDIALTSMAISIVSVALVEIVKAATPAILLILGILRGTDQPSLQRMLIICTLTLGVALTSLGGELSFNMLGFVTALAALFVCSAKLFLIEILLSKKENIIPIHSTPNEMNGLTNTSSSSTGTAHTMNSDLVLHPSTSLSSLSLKSPTHGEPNNIPFNTPRHRSTKSITSSPSAPATRLTPTVTTSDDTTTTGTVSMSQASMLSNDIITLPIEANGVIHDDTVNKNNKHNDDIISVDDDEEERASTAALASTSRNTHNARHDLNDMEYNNKADTILLLDEDQHEAVHGLPCPEPSVPTIHTTHHKLHPMLSLFYFSPVSFVILLIFFLLTEFPHLLSHESVAGEKLNTTIMLIALGACMSFAFNVVELIVIQVTSALSLCVLAISKLILVIIIAGELFPASQHMSTVNQIGCLISVLGVALYNFMKYQQYLRNQEIGSSNNLGSNNHGQDGGLTIGSEKEELLIGKREESQRGNDVPNHMTVDERSSTPPEFSQSNSSSTCPPYHICDYPDDIHTHLPSPSRAASSVTLSHSLSRSPQQPHQREELLGTRIHRRSSSGS